ncbi:hypothetical protein [Streptomyces pseudoechinosporeus]
MGTEQAERLHDALPTGVARCLMMLSVRLLLCRPGGGRSIAAQ